MPERNNSVRLVIGQSNDFTGGWIRHDTETVVPDGLCNGGVFGAAAANDGDGADGAGGDNRAQKQRFRLGVRIEFV